MKISSFNPHIISKDADNIIKVFEALGFEKRHTKTDILDGNNVNVSLKDANGFHVDVASSNHMERDLTTIRINVDDFDEAYAFFLARGFTNPLGDEIVTTSSSRDIYLISPSGFGITLSQHIKK